MIAKMKIMMTIGLTLFLTITFAETTKVVKPTTPSSLPINTAFPTNEKETLTESEAYKMLYDNQVKSNNSILETIFYALAGLGTAMIFVFASNWWFNEKKVKELTKGINAQINEAKNEALNEVREKINTLSNDKTAEINQMQSKLQEDVTNAITASTLKFTEFTEKIRAEIKEDNKTLSENYQKQLDAFNENYRQQIVTFNETINTQFSYMKEILNGKEALLKELILAEQNKRVDEINVLLQQISRVEYYMWKDSGNFRNAIASLISELGYMLKKKTNPTMFALNLKQMSETLDNCAYLYSFDKDSTIDLMKQIPDNDEILKLKSDISMKLEKINLFKP